MAGAYFPSQAVTRPPRMPALHLLIFLLPVFSHLPHLQMAFLGMREQPQTTGMSPVFAGPQPFAIKGRRLRCPVPAGCTACVLSWRAVKGNFVLGGAPPSFPFTAMGSERPPPLSGGSCPAGGNKVVQSWNSQGELELNSPGFESYTSFLSFCFFKLFFFNCMFNFILFLNFTKLY